MADTPAPPERTETDRQRLLRALDQGEPLTIPDLSQIAGIPQARVAELLDAMIQGRHVPLEVLPAYCMGCGFRFEDRSRSQRPSRCPKCRSGRIVRPRFQRREDG